MAAGQPELFEYGIQLEQSDIRVHVSPSTRRLYVFPTAGAQKLLAERGKDYPDATAMQPGVQHVTGMGKLVPVSHIPYLQMVDLGAGQWWMKFRPELKPETKGRMAVRIVCWALRKGRLPLWISDAHETDSVKIQRSGTDIVIWARLRIQVKCDWSAGPKDLGGSGNLFLQQKECNPRRRY